MKQDENDKNSKKRPRPAWARNQWEIPLKIKREIVFSPKMKGVSFPPFAVADP
jgi:hypothetical protein